VSNPLRPFKKSGSSAKPASKLVPKLVSRKGGNVRRVASSADLGFWHQPAVMTLTADLLMIAASILLLIAGWAAMQRMAVLPLRHLVVMQPLDKVSPLLLEQSVRGVLTGNLLTVDLQATRAAIETLPWVHRADVRKRWPDTLEVRIEEHQVVARWSPDAGEPRLVSAQGDVFVADTEQTLPVFIGPEGSAPRILARHEEFNAGLSEIGRHVVAVQLSAREAWRVRLDDGVIVDLGRDQDKQALASRLSRFVSTYPKLREQLPVAFNTVDMRYPNGFAVRTEAARAAQSAS
jgi:cell division protein FtsQ